MPPRTVEELAKAFHELSKGIAKHYNAEPIAWEDLSLEKRTALVDIARRWVMRRELPHVEN